MKTKLKKESLPVWAEPLLQGLAYWLGYKQNLYRHYPLTEGAIVGESVSLIYANLAQNEKLECEILYKDIHKSLDDLSRADLVITDNENNKPSVLIEVKRGQAPITLIEKDLNRLGDAKNILKNIRCFLLLVSQGKRPDKFVNEKGKALNEIKISNYNCFVRRVCKASGSFEKKENAHYALLIEILSQK